jgi:DNA-binding MarR family transcriptional regulator
MTDDRSLAATERAMRRHIAALDLDVEAAHAVSSIFRAANAVRTNVTNEVLRPYDVTWTGFMVMWVVWTRDGIESRHAAEAAAISKATLTGVVRTLETKGWMDRRVRADDRRLVELHLTEAGVRVMDEVYPKFNAAQAGVVRVLTSRRTRDMAKSLHDIVTGLEASRDGRESA